MQAMGLVNDHLTAATQATPWPSGASGSSGPSPDGRELRCRAMSVDTPEQLKGLRRAGRVVALALQVLKDAVAPGVSTGELDRIAADVFASHGARSGPILTYGYPGSICISVDEQVVHGVPGKRVLEPGELVSLDVAAEVDGYHADAAVTVPVGAVDEQRRKLVEPPARP